MTHTEMLLTEYLTNLMAECNNVISTPSHGREFLIMRLDPIRVRNLANGEDRFVWNLLEKPEGVCFFLLGTTGIGKTTTLYQIAQRFTKLLIDRNKVRLPFLLKATDIAEQGYMRSIQDEFKARAGGASKIKNQHLEIEELLADKFERGALLLLVDMFNSLTIEGKQQFAQEMANFQTANGQLLHEQNVALVASRAEPIQEVRFRFQAFQFLELPPLSPEEIEGYIKKKLTPRSPDAPTNFLSIFRDIKTRLSSLIELPIYLEMAVEAYDPELSLGQNRIRLRHEAAIHERFLEKIVRIHVVAKYEDSKFEIRELDLSPALLTLGELTSNSWRAGGIEFNLPRGFNTKVIGEGREFVITRKDLVEMGLLNDGGGVRYPNLWRFLIAYYQSHHLEEFEPAKWVLTGDGDVPVLLAALLEDKAADFNDFWRRLKSHQTCRQLFGLQARCLLASNSTESLLSDFVEELLKELDEENYSFSVLEGLSELSDRIDRLVKERFDRLSNNQKRRIVYFFGLRAKEIPISNMIVIQIFGRARGHEDRHLVYHLVRAIGECQLKGYTNELRALLASRDPIIVADVRWALRQCNGEDQQASESVRAKLLRLLGNTEKRHFERAHAAGALGRMGDLRNVPPLTRQLRRETSEKAISYICEAIATIFRKNPSAEKEKGEALLAVVEGLGLVTTRDLYYQAATISELYQGPFGNVSLTFGLGFSKDPYDVTSELTGLLESMEKGNDPKLTLATAKARRRLQAPFPQIFVSKELK
jgi:hypothetical protein